METLSWASTEESVPIKRRAPVLRVPPVPGTYLVGYLIFTRKLCLFWAVFVCLAFFRVKFRCEVSEFDISDVRFRFTPFQM